MTETNKEIKNKASTQPKKVEKLITLRGITTSQINQALKANNPYPARVFLKGNCNLCWTEKCFHSLSAPDIPVFFRIKDNQGNYIRPTIKKGSYLQVEGYFSSSDQSSRPSFTAHSYQLLQQEFNQQVLITNE